MRRIIFILLFTLSAATSSVAQIVSLKTNVLMDGLMIPNLDVSVTTGGRTAISASVFGADQTWGKDIRMIGVMPEFRYWLGGRALSGWFVGVGAIGVAYHFRWNVRNFEGDAFGGGVTFGYDFYLARHITLELHGGTCMLHYRHHRFYNGDVFNTADVGTYFESGTPVIPYNVGVSFIYIFK